MLSHPTAIAAGYTPVLHIRTETVATEFAELLRKIDAKAGAVEEGEAQLL